MQRTIKLVGDAEFFGALATAINGSLHHFDGDPEFDHLNDAIEFLSEIARQTRLFERATLLEETDKVAIYEHPDLGDETPVMVYIKARNEYWEESPFWEADVAEIEEWAEFKGE